MTKSQNNDAVGDTKSPPLKPDGTALRYGADQAKTLMGQAAPKLAISAPAATLACTMRAGTTAPPPPGCQQQVWISFFFDGTGNNLDADLGTLKHSNVAKLYRVHREDDAVKGIYRIYVPGVATYFSEVGDDGGSMLGLGSGSKGDARLDWALKEFDEKLAPHVAKAAAPGNTIIDINISLVGFSRGSALARAFVNKLLEERGVNLPGKGWCVKKGHYRLRVRFMGLFDTVASVGLAMSANTTSKMSLVLGVQRAIRDRLTDTDYSGSWPRLLAFADGAQPGADPAPGVYDGHQDWGKRMVIPHMVERVHHFIAAHELRNSFPVESVSVLKNGKVDKPDQFHESVFPGVHSDVGGSYRPGEGARSNEPEEKLGLIPLHVMYQYAIDGGMPLLPKTAWSGYHQADFAMSPSLLQRYNYYQSKVGTMTALGPLMNAHMALYYAWRFRAIRRKEQGDHSEADKIQHANTQFQADKTKLDNEIAPLEKNNNVARAAVVQAQNRRMNYLQSNYGNPNLSSLGSYDAAIKSAAEHQRLTQDALLRAKAKRDALPNMENFASIVDMYDKQLVADAMAIREVYTARGMFGGAPDSAKHKELRPHYKAMLDAYENEYIHNKGLKDEVIIAFFDNYVHDSLSGFAKDATLPSDPRVIYLGGDEKYKYAMLESGAQRADQQLA